MRSILMVALLAILVVFGAGAVLAADDAASSQQAAAKVTMPVVVAPNELRTYKASVSIEGCVGIDNDTPINVNALNTMTLLHQYGKREGDGLLQLDVSAIDVVATINGEQSPAASGQFPKLTFLLDMNWKVNRVFGIEGTRYQGQVPGMNYANLIMLFFIPEADKPHAVGETWTSRFKLPGMGDDATVKTTIKSLADKDGLKSAVIHQDYSWGEQKLDGGRSVKSTASADSTFDLSNGKLLKAHAECQLPFSEPSQTKPENRQYKAATKIDITQSTAATQTPGK